MFERFFVLPREVGRYVGLLGNEMSVLIARVLVLEFRVGRGGYGLHDGRIAATVEHRGKQRAKRRYHR
jgi:hypothetical protein